MQDKKPETYTTDRARLMRLYLSDKGIWRYEIERGGVVRWSSLHTRDEGEAKRKYDRLHHALMDLAE